MAMMVEEEDRRQQLTDNVSPVVCAHSRSVWVASHHIGGDDVDVAGVLDGDVVGDVDVDDDTGY